MTIKQAGGALPNPTPLDLDALESGLAASGNSIGPWYSLPRDDLRALIAELRRLRAAGEWVACSERMPESQETVLVFTDGEEAVAHWGGRRAWWLHGAGHGNVIPDHEVTHWRPLPSPPVVQT